MDNRSLARKGRGGIYGATCSFSAFAHKEIAGDDSPAFLHRALTEGDTHRECVHVGRDRRRSNFYFADDRPTPRRRSLAGLARREILIWPRIAGKNEGKENNDCFVCGNLEKSKETSLRHAPWLGIQCARARELFCSDTLTRPQSRIIGVSEKEKKKKAHSLSRTPRI